LGRLYSLLYVPRDGVVSAWDVLPDALVVGLIAAVLGIVAAFIAAPILHHWSPTVPEPKVTVYGAAAAGGLGVVAAAVSAVPVLLRTVWPSASGGRRKGEIDGAEREGQEAGYR
jgi:hypothetical protein